MQLKNDAGQNAGCEAHTNDLKIGFAFVQDIIDSQSGRNGFYLQREFGRKFRGLLLEHGHDNFLPSSALPLEYMVFGLPHRIQRLGPKCE